MNDPVAGGIFIMKHITPRELAFPGCFPRIRVFREKDSAGFRNRCCVLDEICYNDII